MYPSRSLLAFACLAFSCLLVTGCNKATTKGRPAESSYLAESWDELSVSRVAFIGVRSTLGDEPGRVFAETVVRGELQGNQTRFVILTERMARQRAEQAGKMELYERVARVWKDDELIDQFLCRELCADLGVDALMAGTLNAWESETIDPSQEGTSFSRVGVGLYLFSGETGLLVWGAEREEREDSIPYRPADGASSSFSSTGAAAREERRADQAVPEPPPIEKVAREVMGELIAALPPKPAASSG